jgi:hypothetical protein
MSKELIERLRLMPADTYGNDAADALEIATAGMNAYCDELGSCRKAAGFGSADDPMAQEGFGAFSDPLCVAAFVESQFKRIVAERDALAAELKAVRGNQTPTVEDINLQEWKGMDGACAWHLIDRYAEDWHHTARLMNAWLEANREELIAELKALREQEPVAGQCRFDGESEWKSCTVVHHLHVHVNPKEWPHYETRALYARPVPAEPVNQSRPLESIESSELRMELHLRAGPRYQCQSKDCKSYEDGPGQFDTCPGCGRKGYLCGSFVLDKNSTQYQQWVERTRDKYRGKSGQKNQSPKAGGGK